MNDKWLAYFGVQPVVKDDAHIDNEVHPAPHEAIDRINRRCLLIYPLSSSGAERLNVYDVEYSWSEKEKLDSIKTYDRSSRTDVKLMKCRKKKKKQQPTLEKMKDLRRRKVNRSYCDALDTGTRKRVGPTLRTLAIDFSSMSPHFRYYLSESEKSIRMRQLEFGLSKNARLLARRIRSCRVQMDRMEPLLLEAYSRPCVVKVDRMSDTELWDACTLLPSISMNRLTPDQIATGLLIPEAALTHNLLQVRLSRFDSIFNCADCSSPMCTVCQVSYSGDRTDVDQDFHDPTFLIPESPPHQKLGLLEPEEIALPGQFSSISGDHESGDSCEIASLASSSAASVAQTCDNYCQGNHSRREGCSPPDSLVRSMGVPRKQIQLFRTSSYPMSAADYSNWKTKEETTELGSLKRKLTKQKRRTIPACSISRIRRQHRKYSLDFQTRVTRSSTKTLSGVVIFQNRNRSGIC